MAKKKKRKWGRAARADASWLPRDGGSIKHAWACIFCLNPREYLVESKFTGAQTNLCHWCGIVLDQFAPGAFRYVGAAPLAKPIAGQSRAGLQAVKQVEEILGIRKPDLGDAFGH